MAQLSIGGRSINDLKTKKHYFLSRNVLRLSFEGSKLSRRSSNHAGCSDFPSLSLFSRAGRETKSAPASGEITALRALTTPVRRGRAAPSPPYGRGLDPRGPSSPPSALCALAPPATKNGFAGLWVLI